MLSSNVLAVVKFCFCFSFLQKKGDKLASYQDMMDSGKRFDVKSLTSASKSGEALSEKIKSLQEGSFS